MTPSKFLLAAALALTVTDCGDCGRPRAPVHAAAHRAPAVRWRRTTPSTGAARLGRPGLRPTRGARHRWRRLRRAPTSA